MSTSCRCSHLPFAIGRELSRSAENATPFPSSHHDGRKTPPPPPRGRLCPARLQVENPKVGRPACPRCHKDDLGAVGGERGLIVKGRVIRQPLQPAAVRPNTIQICGPVALRGERDPLPV